PMEGGFRGMFSDRTPGNIPLAPEGGFSRNCVSPMVLRLEQPQELVERPAEEQHDEQVRGRFEARLPARKLVAAVGARLLGGVHLQGAGRAFVERRHQPSSGGSFGVATDAEAAPKDPPAALRIRLVTPPHSTGLPSASRWRISPKPSSRMLGS